MRLTNLSRDAIKALDLIPDFGELDDVRKAGPAALLSGWVARPLADALDLSKPVDLTMAGAEGEQFVACFVVDDAAAIERSFTLIPRQAGVAALEPKATLEDVLYDDVGTVCELWTIDGVSERRVICSLSKSVPPDHASYLAWRSLQPSGDDVAARLELPSTLWKGIMEEAADEVVIYDPAERIGVDAIRPLAEDIRRVGIDVQLLADRGVVGFDLAFESTRGLISSLVLSHRSTRPLPPAFFRLPDDALIALQWEGMQPGTRAEDAMRLLMTVMESTPEEVMDPAGHEETARAFADLFLTGGPVIFASGLDADAAADAIHDYGQGSPDDLVRLARARDTVAGWWIVGMPEPFERWRAGILRLLQLTGTKYNRYKVPSGSRGGAAAGPRSIPTLDYAAVVPVSKADRLPEDTLYVIMGHVANSAYVPPPDVPPPRVTPQHNHVFVFHLEDHTWICSSRVKTDCVERVRQMQAGDAGTLARDPGAAALRGLAGTSAGFLTAAGVLAAVMETGTPRHLEDAGHLLGTAAKLPGRGRGKMPVAATSTNAPGGSQGTLRMTVTVPYDDLVAWFMTLGLTQDQATQ